MVHYVFCLHKNITATVQQEYPRDEWHRWGRRQKDTHTRRLHRRGSFFFFFNDSSVFIEWMLPPPYVTTYYIRYWFVLPSIFFPHVFPLSIHLEHFRLQDLYLNVPYIVFLPQWPNILTLTKTMFHRFHI